MKPFTRQFFPNELDHLSIMLFHWKDKLFIFNEVSATLYNCKIQIKDPKENKNILGLQGET